MNGQEAHGKMPHVTSHQGNTHQTTVSYGFTHCRMATDKKQKITNAGENLQKLEASCTVGWGECKMLQLLWKTVWWVIKKSKRELPYDPALHFWVHTQN